MLTKDNLFFATTLPVPELGTFEDWMPSDIQPEPANPIKSAQRVSTYNLFNNCCKVTFHSCICIIYWHNLNISGWWYVGGRQWTGFMTSGLVI